MIRFLLSLDPKLGPGSSGPPCALGAMLSIALEPALPKAIRRTAVAQAA